MDKYTTYQGKFLCKTCDKTVTTMRFYKQTGIGSWMCSEKHLSKVQVCTIGYKKKGDYEREKRK